jgi:hypothetical protein
MNLETLGFLAQLNNTAYLPTNTSFLNNTSFLPTNTSFLPNNINLTPNYFTNLMATNNNTNMSNNKNYFLVPGQDFEYQYYYQNINKDIKLRKMMVNFYTDELLEGVEIDPTFTSFKNTIKNFEKNLYWWTKL